MVPDCSLRQMTLAPDVWALWITPWQRAWTLVSWAELGWVAIDVHSAVINEHPMRQPEITWSFKLLQQNANVLTSTENAVRIVKVAALKRAVLAFSGVHHKLHCSKYVVNDNDRSTRTTTSSHEQTVSKWNEQALLYVMLVEELTLTSKEQHSWQ